jgi:hypothetical protein
MVRPFQKYYGTDRAAKAIYGVVLIFAFLIGQGHDSDKSSLSLVFSTFFAGVAIVLAEIYSEILGKTIRQKNRLSKNQRKEIERDSLAIISVSFWPSLVFACSAIGLFSTQVAFNVSYGLCLAALFLFSFWAARLSNFSTFTAVGRAALIVALGLVVVIAKYELGH